MARKQKATHTCCGRVYYRGVWDPHGHTCGIGARYQDERDGRWYCKTHAPAIRKEKVDKALAAHNAEWDRKNAASDLRNRGLKRNELALAIVRQIAAGHNDPRQLCSSLLKEYADLD